MGRSPCCEREGLNKRAWTTLEDSLLVKYVEVHGEGKWRNIPKLAGLKRCGKSCRLRWLNYLRPDIKRGNISPDEEDLIVRLHRLLGNRWSLIAGRLPGRTDNEIKNYWNTNLSKKLKSLNNNNDNFKMHQQPQLQPLSIATTPKSTTQVVITEGQEESSVVSWKAAADQLMNSHGHNMMINTTLILPESSNEAEENSWTFDEGALHTNFNGFLDFIDFVEFDNNNNNAGANSSNTDEHQHINFCPLSERSDLLLPGDKDQIHYKESNYFQCFTSLFERSVVEDEDWLLDGVGSAFGDV